MTGPGVAAEARKGEAITDVRRSLAEHPFFADLEPRLIDLVAPMAQLRSAPLGTVLARTGDHADSFLAVRSGRVGIELHSVGRAPVVVSTVHAGEVVGWSWFVAPHRWHFDVTALGQVELIDIDAAPLRVLCEREHEFGYYVARRLVRVMSSRLEGARHQLVDLYGAS